MHGLAETKEFKRKAVKEEEHQRCTEEEEAGRNKQEHKELEQRQAEEGHHCEQESNSGPFPLLQLESAS